MLATTANLCRAQAALSLLLLAVAMPSWTALAVPPAAAEPPFPDGRGRVFRFVAMYQRLHKADHRVGHLELLLEPAGGGEPQPFKVPNTLPDGRYSPAPQTLKTLQAMEPGSLLAAQLGSDGQPRNLTRYAARRGEDTPRGHVFVRTDRRRVGRWEYTTLHLTKYGRPTEVLIPNRTTREGGQRSDRRIAAVVRRLRPGDVVMLWVNPFGQYTFAADLHPYGPPRTVTVVRLEPGREGDGDGHGDGRAALLVKLSRGGEERIPLPHVGHDGRPLNNPASLVPPTVAEPGRVVEITTRDEDGVSVLSEVRLPGTVRSERRDLLFVQSGEAGLTCFRDRGEPVWHVNAHTYGRGDDTDDRTLVKLGLPRLLDDPANQAEMNLAEPVVAALAEQRAGGPFFDDAMHQPWADAIGAWVAATDPVTRDQVEQELFRTLQQLADRQRAVDEERVQRVRALLDHEQFERVRQLGRGR